MIVPNTSRNEVVLLHVRPAGPVGSVDRSGERRLLATIGSDGSTTWHPPPDEPIAPDSEVVVAATRKGLADLLLLSHAGA